MNAIGFSLSALICSSAIIWGQASAQGHSSSPEKQTAAADTTISTSPDGHYLEGTDGRAGDTSTPPMPSVPVSDLAGPSALPVVVQPKVTWDLASPSKLKDPQVRPDPIWDKKMWAVHTLLLGSMVFDVEVTHQGLAHHKCIEGDHIFGDGPSRADMYADNAPAAAGVIVMDALLAAAARNHGHFRHWKLFGYGIATVSSVLHLEGGTKWLTSCW